METIKKKFYMDAQTEFLRLLIAAKNKDAALSTFDRSQYENDLKEELRLLFHPIRMERIERRKMMDIGAIADKRIFKRKDVVSNISLAKHLVKTSERADEVLLGLLLLTGRRTSEVVGGTYFLHDKFVGTIKGGNESGTARYLCSFDTIVIGIKKLKANGWRDLTVEEGNLKCAVPLMRKLQIFKGVSKVHDLRKMHVAVWIDRLTHRKSIKMMPLTERNEFIGRFVNDALGHTNPTSAIPYLNSKIV